MRRRFVVVVVGRRYSSDFSATLATGCHDRDTRNCGASSSATTDQHEA